MYDPVLDEGALVYELNPVELGLRTATVFFPLFLASAFLLNVFIVSIFYLDLCSVGVLALSWADFRRLIPSCESIANFGSGVFSISISEELLG